MSATLTADLIARAVIAAAEWSGTKPTTAKQILEAGRYPAAVALAVETHRGLSSICDMLGVLPDVVITAREALPERFRIGKERAQAAIKVQMVLARRAEAAAPAPAPRRPPVRVRPATPRAPFVASAERTLRERVLEQLHDAPSTAPSLAVLCDAKEMEVTGVLRCLEHEKLALPGAPPVGGARHRLWSIAPEQAA